MSRKPPATPKAPKPNPKAQRQLEPAGDETDQFEDDFDENAHADAAASDLNGGAAPSKSAEPPQKRTDTWGDDDPEFVAADADHFYDEDDFDESWLQRLNLEAPLPRPGFDQRWVASKVMGEDLPVNATRQYRQGWRPRDPRTVPTGFFPHIEDPDGIGFIGFAGLILMERPMKITRRAERLLKEETQRRTRSIDSQLREKEEPEVPFQIHRRTSVTNRRPQVAEE